MNGLIRLRNKVKAFYGDYSVYILPILKFGLAILIYILINQQLGYLEILNNLFVLLILAAISAILPLNGTALIGTFLIVAHCFGLGLEIGAFAAILYLLMLLLYFRFVQRDALALLLGPIAFHFQVPAAVPLCLGVMRGPESAISAICSVISWKFVHVISETIAPIKSSAETSPMRMIQILPGELFNQELVVIIITFAATAVIVSFICRHLTTFTRLTALIVGVIVYLFVTIAGSFVMKADIDLKWTVIGAVISFVIALIMNLFVYSVDYSKAKYIQFEDDEYYYYVKAIPKIGARDIQDDYEDIPPAPRGQSRDSVPPVPGEYDGVDFKTRLEDSLKDL